VPTTRIELAKSVAVAGKYITKYLEVGLERKSSLLKVVSAAARPAELSEPFSQYGPSGETTWCAQSRLKHIESRNGR
jgi:hypothetical protein